MEKSRKGLNYVIEFLLAKEAYEKSADNDHK